MNNHNIAQTLDEAAGLYPDNTALIVKARSGYRSWTFKELKNTVDAFAHDLARRGIGKGDRAMLMVRPSLEFIGITFALFKIGAVIILIDPGMGYRNLLRCIAQVKPAVFIGIPRAHLFKLLFPRPFKTVRTGVCVGFSCGLFGRSLDADRAVALFNGLSVKGHPVAVTGAGDPAAILFTTGSTGPPKGVRYEHGIFQAQLEFIRGYYGITPADIDQAAFPLFALFSTALGACVVIPDMNPARPAAVNAAKFIRSLIEHRVTYSFGSPAIWNVVSRFCLENGVRLPSLKKILMAGAPVSGELIGRFKQVLDPDAEIHTPYGATEGLPIASITGTEVLQETWDLTRDGRGVCVGRPLPSIDIKIIPVVDEPIPRWRKELVLPPGEIGEIVVQGPVVTRSYEANERETGLAKIKDQGDTFRHRMGDVGYLDELGRLWFCGRKTHRVTTAVKTLYTIPCEAVVNEHPAVFRSALVGIGPKNDQVPVLIIEPRDKTVNRETLLAEVREIAGRHPLTSCIKHFLIHASFPVDIRHNAKIFREKLAMWAAERLDMVLEKHT